MSIVLNDILLQGFTLVVLVYRWNIFKNISLYQKFYVLLV